MCVPTTSLREAKHGFWVDIFEKKVTISVKGSCVTKTQLQWDQTLFINLLKAQRESIDKKKIFYLYAENVPNVVTLRSSPEAPVCQSRGLAASAFRFLWTEGHPRTFGMVCPIDIWKKRVTIILHAKVWRPNLAREANSIHPCGRAKHGLQTPGGPLYCRRQMKYTLRSAASPLDHPWSDTWWFSNWAFAPARAASGRAEGLAASQKGCWGVLARPNLACGLTFTEIQNLRPKMA